MKVCKRCYAKSKEAEEAAKKPKGDSTDWKIARNTGITQSIAIALTEKKHISLAEIERRALKIAEFIQTGKVHEVAEEDMREA